MTRCFRFGFCAILFSAATCAIAATNQPPSTNVVIVPCPPGYTTIGNNFRDPLPASSVIASPQDGMELYRWNAADQRYDDPYQYFTGFGWLNPNDPNQPIFRNGEGWWFGTQVPTQARFSGVPGTIQAKPRPANGFYFLSGQTPRPSRFQEVTGYPPQAGDKVYKYDVTVPAFPADPAAAPSSTHVYNGSSWDVEPILNSGKAMWVQLSGPPSTNMVPVVTWVQPPDGSTFPAGSPILMRARATDSDGTVSFVEFFAAPSNAPPLLVGRSTFGGTNNTYTVVWSNAPAGRFRLYAEAVDNAGGRGISGAVGIVVTGGSTSNAPPLVTWVQPPSGSSFPAGSPIVMRARATDSDGTVTFVDFFAAPTNGPTMHVGRSSFGGTNNTYTAIWSNAAPGLFQLHAEAVDNAGGRGISGSVQITVVGTNQPPSEVVVPCPPGYTTIGNNFRDPLPASSVIASPQDGMELYRWNAADQRYDDPYQYFTGFGWLNPNDPNQPIFRNGEGWWFGTQVPTQARFSGVPGTIQAKPRPANGFYFLSGQTPRPSRFQEVTGYPPQAGDKVYKYDVTVPAFPADPAAAPSSTHVYNGSSWDVEPILNSGKAMWVQLSGPPSTNMVPVVTWVQPANGASFPAGSSIVLRARATDSDGTVSFVDFFATPTNGPAMNVGRATFGSTNLYTVVWSNTPAGQFRLHAEAVDNAGGRGISGSVQITVVGTNQPPATNHPPVAHIQVPNSVTFLETLTILAVGRDVGVVVLDASRSFDSDGDPLGYLWSIGNPPTPFASGIRVTNVLETGSYNFQLEVSDGDLSATASTNLVVLAPCDAIGLLIIRIAESAHERKDKRPLISALEMTCREFERGDIEGGIERLQAFQQKVAARFGSANPAFAELLINEAQTLIDAITGE